ncbi:unnamed protein product [Cylicocyclus nassatus]|uniref:HTH OST-type domain-containing protein n=1 Tax=Cylicocyclus nassatus TaxID=53992 RepID=A0AA36M2Q8_CYLNA|nr:unnamed protein product [Cylicocyclus nassatus]
MDGIDTLLGELSSVIMTKTTKGGMTEPQIMKDYQDLCGKRVEFARFGYRSLGDLLHKFPQKFSFQNTPQGVKWFGKVTEENQDIVRSMASEKHKKGRVMPPPNRFPPSFGFRGPAAFGRAPTPFGSNQSRFHHSSSDGFLQDHSNTQGGSGRNSALRKVAPDDFIKTQDIPSKTGFGNKAFNYAPRESTSRSSSPCASADKSGDENDRSTAGGGRPGSATSGHYDEPVQSFREMVGKHAVTPEYPPGLGVGGANEENIDPSFAGHPESFHDIAASGAETPDYPPGLGIGQSSASVRTKSSDRELTETQRCNLEVAQKVYDLLSQTEGGLSVQEIADRIGDKLPKRNNDMIPTAKVGTAVHAHSETFTLSATNKRGIVKIRDNAKRPDVETVAGVPSIRTMANDSSRSMEQNRNIIFNPPRRETEEEEAYNRERNGFGFSFSQDLGGAQTARNPPPVGGHSGSSRFSTPSLLVPRRQPADNYDPYRKAEPYRSPSPREAFRPVHESSYSEDDVGPRRDDDRLPYEDWKNQSRGESARWNPPRESVNGGFSQSSGSFGEERQMRRLAIPLEPKKFECKHQYLTNAFPVPQFENVKLTHFIALDEFYLRSCKEEGRYLDMLDQLREAYKGALDDAEPQLWMKGDGAAVRYDRCWQRAVVRSPVSNTSEKNMEVFLVDVGKTVMVSTEQAVPLHSYFHTSPFALCCTIGSFDISSGRRKEFLDECDLMANCFAEAEEGALEMQSLKLLWDDKEKLMVRMIYRDTSRPRPVDVVVPQHYVDLELISVR